jgi:bifunctional pyridoxal-dependent enzyme with beta-cystathionase and maltose regulon repressor activities
MGSLSWQNNINGKEILPLWVADMDFQSPDVVLDAIRKERTMLSLAIRMTRLALHNAEPPSP